MTERGQALPNQAQPRALTCKEVARRTTEFLENHLSGAQAAAVAQHLEVCSSCRNYVNQMALVRAALRGLPGETPPKRLSKKLLDAMAHNSGA